MLIPCSIFFNFIFQIYHLSYIIFFYLEMSEKVEEIRKRYEADADLRASKPRFGFFSIPPSHTAAKTDFRKAKNRKNVDGRVTVQQRNIFPGSTRSGVLRKSYFSVPQSIYLGDPYSKDFIKQKQQKPSKQEQKREVFKPAKLNKTLSTPAYKYICQNPAKKIPKRNRNGDGAVITKQRNIFTNSMSKIAKQNSRQFKYISSDYDNQKKIRNEEKLKSIINRKGEGPFKSGSPVKEFFCTNIQAYNDHEIKPKIRKIGRNSKNTITHQSSFRPSCRPRNTLFSYPKHDTSMTDLLKLKEPSSDLANNRNATSLTGPGGDANKREPFRLSSKKESMKPSPSIAYSKLNLLKNMR